MEKLRANPDYKAILMCLIVLAMAGSFFAYQVFFPPGNIPGNLSQDTTHGHQPVKGITALSQPVSPSVPAPAQMHSPKPSCDPFVTNSRIPVPENISIAIRDPMPGIRYSLYENASETTVVLEREDLVEITLPWAPGLGCYWIVPVSGCGLEVVQAGTYSNGGDFWNNTGQYRIRYRAVTSGTSHINGRFGLHPDTEENPDFFNLTVKVK